MLSFEIHITRLWIMQTYCERAYRDFTEFALKFEKIDKVSMLEQSITAFVMNEMCYL